jgi:prolyl oligopeptidase
VAFGKSILGVCVAAAVAGAALAQGAGNLTPDSPDPYLWLSDIHGAKPLAWAAAQNERTDAAFKTDPDYKKFHHSILSVLNANDRIALGGVDHGEVYNFWQDAAHVRGFWRRTAIADYARPKPQWDVLLDVDKLDAREHKDWVWQDASCALMSDLCLVRLSPGGSDASVVREYDRHAKAFVAGGFTLPLAKSDSSYVDKDTILFGTDFGPGSLTASGYPRIVKLWHRGTPISAARIIYEAKASDVSAQPVVFSGPYGTIPLVARGITFFTNEYYWVRNDGSTVKLPLPLGADLKGVTHGNILFTLRNDWTPPGGKLIPQGSLVAFDPWRPIPASGTPVFEVLYTPDARSTIEDVSAGRDAVYAAIFQNVTGTIREFRLRDNDTWFGTALSLPKGGSTHIVSTDDWSPQAYFTFESFLQPVTLYADDRNEAPAAIKAEPARFDASGLVSEQFDATSADGTKIPYFFIHAKATRGPVPTILYAYGGFALSVMPWYWNDEHKPLDTGETWLRAGGAIVVANIRGGGEFGPAWHQGAMKKNHQHAFDDFEAVAADIERRGFAYARQVGSVGASNGGLLVSAAMAQRPDLFGAVVCQRPLIDMLRYTHFGAGASWTDEYGDPANPQERGVILKYSPYENLKPGVKYPPILLLTETSDDRVTPVFARMMAAKMEAMNQDVLFYESLEGGHGPGATHEEQAQMWALSYAYLAQKLGLHAHGAP